MAEDGGLREPCFSASDDASGLLIECADARTAAPWAASSPRRKLFIAAGAAVSVLLLVASSGHHYWGGPPTPAAPRPASAAAEAGKARPHGRQAPELGAAAGTRGAVGGGAGGFEHFISLVAARAKLLEQEHASALLPHAPARGLSYAPVRKLAQALGPRKLQKDQEAALAGEIDKKVNDTYVSPGLNETKLLQATCVIDVLYIVACLGYAIDGLFQVSASTHSRCPSSSAQGCAVELTNVISCLSWVAFGISAAVSDCPQVVNQQAVCASDIIGMVADVTGITSAAIDVGSSCGAAAHPPPTEEERQQVLQRLTSRLRRLKAGRGYMVNVTTEARAIAAEQLALQTGFSIATCVFDVIMAGALLMQIGTTIARATEDCPNPRACAVDMLTIIGCVSWTAASLASAASDCDPPLGNVAAGCAADITNIIANLNFLAAYSTAIGEDCNFSNATNATNNDTTDPVVGPLSPDLTDVEVATVS